MRGYVLSFNFPVWRWGWIGWNRPFCFLATPSLLVHSLSSTLLPALTWWHLIWMSAQQNFLKERRKTWKNKKGKEEREKEKKGWGREKMNRFLLYNRTHAIFLTSGSLWALCLGSQLLNPARDLSNISHAILDKLPNFATTDSL